MSNVDIERYVKSGEIEINPYELKNVQGATIDFRLDKGFLIPDYYNDSGQNIIELNRDFPFLKKDLEAITILPQHFILGSTLETMKLPNYLCARVDGKSRIGRKGLVVQTAGHIGPGFEGKITLELFNANQVPIKISYGQQICQIEFHELSSPSTKTYSGQYFRQKGAKV